MSRENLATYLHLDIQYADPPLLGNVLDRLDAGAIVIAAKLRMLDEAAFVHERQEFLLGREVVLSSVLLPRARRARRVWKKIQECSAKFSSKGVCLSDQVLYRTGHCKLSDIFFFSFFFRWGCEVME